MPPKKDKDEPENDPYDVLGISPQATDAAITKAFRKLALKLHPDKQSSKSEQELERIAKVFHDVNEARAFLLDAEFKEARAKYDAKRASIKRRREADAQRELGLSDRRKRMREDLKQQEEQARRDQQQSTTTTSSGISRRGNRDERAKQEKLEKLRREGQQAREAYAQQKARAAAVAEAATSQSTAESQQQRQQALENRQVRLKWSRKKMTTSPSEHSLASNMAEFGTVEQVELLGSKGNMALITFADAASCRPCVQAYKTNEQMRAHFVGWRKEEEELREAAAEHGRDDDGKSHHRDKESLQERHLRQQAERERLMREMQAEETGGPSARGRPRTDKNDDAEQNLSERSNAVKFPATEEYRHLTPLQKLELAERKILGEFLSAEDMRLLQQTQ